MNEDRILIVEDDQNLGQILDDYLRIKGFITALRRDGNEGYKAFMQEEFDLCILDVMMPKKDGFTLAKEIRKINSQIPIIFLTAKSMKEDTINGFQIGADDYVTKPFSMEELLLRIKAILKRTSWQSKKEDIPKEYDFGKCKLLHHQQLLLVNGEEKSLTTKECELLQIFVENINSLVDRTLALKKIWKDDSYFNARSMDVYIAKLRKHLSGDPTLKIQTVHGQGFKLVTLDD